MAPARTDPIAASASPSQLPPLRCCDDRLSPPGYSPDLMPVEALWRWLREDVT
jgi:transposase